MQPQSQVSQVRVPQSSQPLGNWVTVATVASPGNGRRVADGIGSLVGGQRQVGPDHREAVRDSTPRVEAGAGAGRLEPRYAGRPVTAPGGSPWMGSWPHGPVGDAGPLER